MIDELRSTYDATEPKTRYAFVSLLENILLLDIIMCSEAHLFDMICHV